VDKFAEVKVRLVEEELRSRASAEEGVTAFLCEGLAIEAEQWVSYFAS